MSHEIVAASSPMDDFSRGDEAASGQDDEQAKASNQRRRKQRVVPSVEDCLCAIAALPGLIALKILTNAEANAIRASYEAILRHHERRQQAPSQHASDEHILKMVREKPELLDLLEPFLTPDQLSIVIQEFKDDDEGEA